MALVGTISGSNGTSATAVTGTLVIANVSSNFPSIPSDVVLFVSGAVGGGSRTVIGGDLVVSGGAVVKSNLTLSGASVFIDGDVSIDDDLIYIDQVNSRVGIGTSTPEATLTVRSQGTGNTRGITGLHYDDTTAFSQFKFIGGRSRGSAGSPTAVQANDTLVSFNARGRTDVGWSNTVGGVYIYARENWSSTNTPTFFTFRGVSNGAGTTVSEWGRLDNTQLSVTGSLITSGGLQVKDSAGNTVGSISTNGSVSGSGNFQIGGSIVVRGAFEVTGGINNRGPENHLFSGAFANFNFNSQSFVGVDTTLSSYTGTLPVISGEYVGRLYNVKDVGGNCGTNAFVITASSPNKIDGATELKLSSTSGSVALIAGLSGSSYNWYIVSYT